MITRVKDLPIGKNGTIIEIIKITSRIVFIKIKDSTYRIRNVNNNKWLGGNLSIGDKIPVKKIKTESGHFNLVKDELSKSNDTKVKVEEAKQKMDESAEKLLLELGYEEN